MHQHPHRGRPTCGGRDGGGGGGGSSGPFRGGNSGGVVVLAPWSIKPTGAVTLGAHGRPSVLTSRGFITGVTPGPRPPRWADTAVAHCCAAAGAAVGDVHRLAGGTGVTGWAKALGQVGDAAVVAGDWKRVGGRRVW